MEDERFDGLFMNVANQAKGIEPLLDNLFSFLRRKTDFFVGATPVQVEETVMSAVKKHQAISSKQEAEKKIAKEKEQKKKQLLAEKKAKENAAKEIVEKEAKKKSFADAAAAAGNDDDVLELGGDGSFDTTEKSSAPAKVPKVDKVAAPSSGGIKFDEASSKALSDELSPDEVALREKEEEEDKTPAPLGNGGTIEGKYTWTQTLSEVDIRIPLPAGTKPKMLDVNFTNTKLKVGVKGQPPICDGLFHKRIIVDDSFWTIEDGELVFNIQKDDKMNWWKCVMEGDPEINTQKVQPENSKLSDLDGDTRQTVEKMMFDQRQKAAGLPSSDELQKQEMLKKFMDQHPEMDFSKAKFN